MLRSIEQMNNLIWFEKAHLTAARLVWFPFCENRENERSVNLSVKWFYMIQLRDNVGALNLWDDFYSLKK